MKVQLNFIDNNHRKKKIDEHCQKSLSVSPCYCYSFLLMASIRFVSETIVSEIFCISALANGASSTIRGTISYMVHVEWEISFSIICRT